MSTAYSFVGSQHTWFAVLDSTGYLKGTTGTIANGADAGMGRLNGVNSVGLTIPEARAIVYEGDNGTKGVQLINANTAPEGEIVTSIADLTFQTQAQSLSTFTLGNTVTQILGPSCPVFKTLALIVNSPALDQTAGNVGQAGWHSYIFWKNQVQPRSGTIENGNASSFSHKTVATYADTSFWGDNLEDWDTVSGLILDLGWSAYPWTAHTFVGDNSATSFTLDETPAAESGNAVLAWADGTALVYGGGAGQYSVVASTKTVTFGTAPAAAVNDVFLYQYIPTC